MLNDPRFAAYAPGDVVGKSGVEQSYDSILRGVDGSRDVIVNSHGKEIGQLGREPVTPGKSLRLTIDLDVQRAAELALGERNGAIVAMDPRTGEILAMVSRPTFDPNSFAVRISRQEWNRLITDENHPLMNKAIQAQLAPGSTFKILMSAAGLEEGVAEDMRINCPGGGTFYGHFFACHARHGSVDIHHAIPWSCDTFFYTLAEKLGITTISKWATRLGLGQRTGIDLPDEASGTMPSEQWKMKTFHEKWYAGETISVGIGQGAVAVTPIQLARAISGIASDGQLKRPHVVFPDEIPEDAQRAYQDSFPGSRDQSVPIHPENWETITDGMAMVTQPGGTAAASHLEGIDFAGKTGTAQVASHEAIGRLGGGHKMLANAWFIGVAPRRNPEIVVAVLWQNGAEGPFAARLAAQVVQAYVNKHRRIENNLRLADKEQPKADVAIMNGEPAEAAKSQVAVAQKGSPAARPTDVPNR